MTYKGINFRQTSGYVTDGTDDTYSLGEAYPTTRGGLTFGFSSSAAADTRNRNTGVDARLAGIVFQSNTSGLKTFRLDLPNGAGTYRIRLAPGDYGAAQDNKIVIKDDSTTLDTISVSTITNRFSDATGYSTNGGMTAGGWVTGNTVIERTFSSSILNIEIGGHSSGTTASALAHVAVEFVGGADATAPVLTSPDFIATGSTTGTASVSTDEGNGTLYCVVTTSSTSPSASQIKAGNDHTGSAAVFSTSQAVSGTGTQNVSVTGLTASTTYYAHFVHDDSAANESNVSSDTVGDTTGSGTFTLTADFGSYTVSGQSATLSFVQPGVYTLTAESGTYTITGYDGYRTIHMSADYGTYSLSGQDVTLSITEPAVYTLVAEYGTYSLTGRRANLLGPGDTPSLGPGDIYVKLKLLNYTGALNDMLLKYYQDNGATSSNINTAEMQWLANEGFTQPNINDRRKAFFQSFGYSGSMNDMEKQYWWNL